jgi:predicted RNA binding protein YcfA (HicA-like mRNA interferase family)
VKTVSGKDFTKLLEKKGWELRRIKGSHHPTQPLYHGQRFFHKHPQPGFQLPGNRVSK